MRNKASNQEETEREKITNMQLGRQRERRMDEWKKKRKQTIRGEKR